MALFSCGQRNNLGTLLTVEEQSALEDLAVAIKCIISCRRAHFGVEHLKKELGPNDPLYPPLNSDFFDYPLTTLVGENLVEEERRSEPQYIVRDFGKLRAFYEEEVKGQLPKTFIQNVLGERV